MKIHGEWEITLVGNVVVQTIAGSFNEEGAQARARDLRAIAPVGTPWALLGNASNWDLGNAATLKIVDEMREWMMRHACVCIATIVPPGFRRAVHQEHTRKLPADVLKYCATLGEACSWLNERGFAISPDDYPHHAFLARTKPR